jgi:hypothetical protein
MQKSCPGTKKMQENFSKTNVKKYFKQIFFKTFGAKSF